MKKTKNQCERSISYTSLNENLEYKTLEKICKGFAFVMLIVYPFVIGPKLYIDITEVKFYVFTILSLLFIAACSIIYIVRKLSSDNTLVKCRSFKGVITVPQILIIAYLVWGIISACLSDFEGLFIGQSRYEGVLSMLLYGFIFIFLSFWGEFTNRYLYGLASSSILLGFFAFTQIMGSHFMYLKGYNYATTGFLSTLGNIDIVSGYISIALPALCISFILLVSKLRFLSLAGIVCLTYVQMAIDVDSGKMGLAVALIATVPFILNSKRNIVRATIMFSSVFASIGIQKLFVAQYNETSFAYEYITTHSVLGIASIIVAILLGFSSVIMQKYLKELSISPKKICAILFGIIIIAFIAGLVAVYSYSGSNNLLIELSDVLHGNLSDEAGSGRGIVWKRTLQLIGLHPIIGSGTGSFLEAFAPYNVGLDAQFDFAHNDFLQIAACQGIVGLLLYLGFLVSLAIRAYKNVFKCPWLLVFISSIAGYLTHSFFSFSIAIITPLFWVMAGLLDKMIRQIPETADGLVWPREEIELIENSRENAGLNKNYYKQHNKKTKRK